jgi:hypothetical protein
VWKVKIMKCRTVILYISGLMCEKQFIKFIRLVRYIK